MTRQDAGKRFEQDFIQSAPNTVFSMRLRDMGGKYNRLVNVKNICDFLIYRYPTLYLFELKSTKAKSMPFSNLKLHQIAGLYVANKKRGIVGGFIFNFRQTNETYFIRADKVKEFYEQQTRKSFPLDWCKENGKKIEQQKKITRWTYKVDTFLDEI